MPEYNVPRRVPGRESSRLSMLRSTGLTSRATISEDNEEVYTPSVGSSADDSPMTTGDEKPKGERGSSGRRLPNRHASLPQLSKRAGVDAAAAAVVQQHGRGLSQSVTGHPEAQLKPGHMKRGESFPLSQGNPPLQHRSGSLCAKVPSRLSSLPGANCRSSFASQVDSPCYEPGSSGTRDTPFLMSSFGPQSGILHSNNATGNTGSLLSMQKAVERLMLGDPEVYRKVKSSMAGISSLAKETSTLEVKQDATGATCINQYVVVKTLGRGR